MAKKKNGRPVGSKNVATVVNVKPANCPNCQSTKRTLTGSQTVQEFEGTIGNEPYNRIVRSRAICDDCGQTRIEQSFEFQPG